MAQCLSEIAPFKEDFGSIPSNPHGGSKPSITPVPGDLMPFSDFIGTKHICGTYTYKQMKHGSTGNKSEFR